MPKPRAFLAGTLLLLWANYVAAASVWPEPYFEQAENEHPNVTWRPTGYARFGGAVIWEGTEGEVELMRLSFQPEGNDEPQIAYTGARGLGLQLKRDDNPLRPFYLIATEPGDYEGGIERFFISVSSPVVSSPGSVTIYLENVNDNPPIISSPAECAVEELYVGPTDCKFVVKDADGGACYAEMTVDDPHFSFLQETKPSLGCKTATFVLIVAKELDFETYRLHSLEITATDDGQIGPDDYIHGGTQERTVAFVVDVIDVPDEPPRWEVIVPSHTVDEKTEWSLDLRAVDGDFGLNWPIVYSLAFAEGDVDAEKSFAINKETGLLSGTQINRDELQREIFKFEVVATEVPDKVKYPDFEAMFVTSDIVVMINDLNDNLPLIEPPGLVYIDFPEEHAFTDKTFTVSDPDLGDHGLFNLTLKDNAWSSNFKLIPPSGYQNTEITITAIDPTKLDYEDPGWRIIELTIVATEEADKSHFSEAKLGIELLDLIDEPPEFEKEEYTVSIEENQPEGILVVHTVAHDPDEQDVITFSLRNLYMEIDDEGHITTINDNAFDYERQTEILLQVVAEDTAGFRAFCQVTINVIDLNDEQPTLKMPYERHQIEEHADEGERASPDIKATDPDTEADLVFEIDWEDSAAYKHGVQIKDKNLFVNSVKLVETKKDGAMWNTHLVVANSFEFDWEVFDTLKLQISVIDKGTHQDYLHNEKSSEILTVILDDINDCVPQFTEETLYQNFTVMENTRQDRILGFIVATDDDSPPFSRIRYSIEPVYPSGLVQENDKPRIVINEETGVLRTTETLIDCDVWKTLVFEYQVTATDGQHETSTTISLYIEDLNDEYPDVIEPESHKIEHSFEEHLPGPQLVGCITGDDIDYTEEFHTITYYIEGAARDLFEMEEECLPFAECCLRAIDGTVLDRELQETHVIEVLMRDNFKDKNRYDSNEGPKTTVTLTLIDINDNPPVFENDGATFQYFESKIPDDKKLFDAEVSDNDVGQNGETYCDKIPRLTSRPERPPETIEGVFEVKTNGPICSLYATKELKGLWGIYTFTLKARDKGDPPLSGEGVYTVIVTNENLNAPEIIFPQEGINILIGRDQVLHSERPLKDIYGNDVPDFKAIDRDDPGTPNGQVSFEMTGDENVFYLYRTSELNTAILQMRSIPPLGKRQFTLTLVATDTAEFNSLQSPVVNVNIYVLNLGSTPEFYEVEDPTNVKLSENTTGLEEIVTLPAARNIDEEYLETQRPIFYYIIEGDTTLFALDRETRELTLKKMLDYEEETEHHLKVLASHDIIPPATGGDNGPASLDIAVEVIDINDMPPRFSQLFFPGTFSVDHDINQKVVQLKAEDPDTDDEITYEMIPRTITASSTSLEQFANDNAFRVDPKTGIVTLNFSPGNRELDGYFSFRVVAYDRAGNVDGHRDYATVLIYVVSTAHQVQFHFYNPVGVIEARLDEMAAQISRIFGYTCIVEKVRNAGSANGGIETSEVLTYFIDDENTPVSGEDIKEKFLKQITFSSLYLKMKSLSLSFTGLRAESPDSV